MVLGGCASEPTESPAAPTETAKVTNAGYYQPVLNLEIDLGATGERSGRLLERASIETLKVGKEMIAGKAPVDGPIETINFTVLGPPSRDGDRKIAHFSIDSQALRQVANATDDPGVVLGEAKEFGSWTPRNDDVISDYCSKRPAASICLDG
jgi:hypothetical protein